MEKQHKHKTFSELISSLKVSDLPKTPLGKIVEISSADSLEEGFQKLVEGGVLSAPVWDENNKTYTGFLDMRDLVSSVVFIADETPGTSTKTLEDLFVNAKWVGGAFTVTYLSRRNPFKAVSPKDPLQKVVDLLAHRGPGKVKRVAVVDNDGRVVNVVSQSTLVARLAGDLAKHPRHVGKTVQQLQLGSAPVLSVEQSASAIDAFRLMDSHQITGLAITQNGKLIGNISSRDLKIFITHIDFNELLTPIGEFVKALRQRDINIKSPTISVFPETNFETVIQKLTATKVHRIFVVDSEESFQPVRVVSLVDVLIAAFDVKEPERKRGVDTPQQAEKKE